MASKLGINDFIGIDLLDFCDAKTLSIFACTSRTARDRVKTIRSYDQHALDDLRNVNLLHGVNYVWMHFNAPEFCPIEGMWQVFPEGRASWQIIFENGIAVSVRPIGPLIGPYGFMSALSRRFFRNIPVHLGVFSLTEYLLPPKPRQQSASLRWVPIMRDEFTIAQFQEFVKQHPNQYHPDARECKDRWDIETWEDVFEART